MSAPFSSIRVLMRLSSTKRKLRSVRFSDRSWSSVLSFSLSDSSRSSRWRSRWPCRVGALGGGQGHRLYQCAHVRGANRAMRPSRGAVNPRTSVSSSFAARASALARWSTSCCCLVSASSICFFRCSLSFLSPFSCRSTSAVDSRSALTLSSACSLVNCNSTSYSSCRGGAAEREGADTVRITSRRW